MQHSLCGLPAQNVCALMSRHHKRQIKNMQHSNRPDLLKKSQRSESQKRNCVRLKGINGLSTTCGLDPRPGKNYIHICYNRY